MKIYCLCTSRQTAKNYLVTYVGKPDPTGTIQGFDLPAYNLPAPMKQTFTGALQVIPAGTGWRRHYPNVDVFECSDCGAKVVRE